MSTLRNIEATNLPPLTWQTLFVANQYVIKTQDNWLASIQMNGDPSREQQEGILQLMITAPELLSALEQMLIAWPYMECETTIKARNAVDKAKGCV